MKDSVEKRTKAGIFWSGLIKGIAQVVSFVFGILLARLLVPEDFGVIAGVTVFTEIAHSIVASGIVSALIQRRDVSEEYYSTAFTMQIGLAVLAYLGLYAISAWVDLFFRSTISGRVLAVTAVSVLVMPFVSIPTAILRRKMDFRAAGIADIVQQLCNGTAAVLLAYLGWGVWSLVYGRVLGFVVKAIHIITVVGWYPRLHFRRDVGRDLFSFSSKIGAANLLNDVASNVDYVMVGRLLGPVQLGFYYRAYSLMSLPTTRITETMNSVFFSAFSLVNEDESAFKQALLKAFYYVSLIAFPVSLLLFWTAPRFIPIVYGEQWVPCILPLQIMSFAGILFSIEPVVVSAITARGYVGFEVKRQLMYVLLLIMGVLLGSHWGIAGVSTAVLLASVILMILLQRLLRKIIGISWYQLAMAVKPVVVACGVMSLAVVSYQQFVQQFALIYSLPLLLGAIIVGLLSYIGTLFFIWNRSENKTLADIVREPKSYGDRFYGLVRRVLDTGLSSRR